MVIRFLRDYRGKLTKEAFHPAGSIADLPAGEAQLIIEQGAAVAVVAQEPAPSKRKARK